jgi:tetratricopeptide (TPR) repeat protein
MVDATPKTPYQQARDLMNRYVNAGGDLLKEEIIDEMRADPALSPETRAIAINFASDRAANPMGYNSLAFRTLKAADGDPADYRKALQRAERARAFVEAQISSSPQAALPVLSVSQRASIWNTLALAYYRAGRYREVVDSCKKAAELRPGNPYDTVVSIMARYRMGQRDAARVDLAMLDKQAVDATSKPLPATASPVERANYSVLLTADFKMLLAEAKALVK